MRLKEFTAPSDKFLGRHIIFHKELNPLLFENDRLKSQIRDGLLKIAEHFTDYLATSLAIKDITISGSNAAYTYTPYSDIDLHIIIDIPEDQQVKDLLDAKKTVYNAQHDIKVKGIDVELYAQDSKEIHRSQGIYSVLHNRWISEPKKEQPSINSEDVRTKYKNYRDKIQAVVKTEDEKIANDAWDSIKNMRRASLAKNGEFAVENLVFKMLRNQGWLNRLKDHINDLENKKLSVEEKNL